MRFDVWTVRIVPRPLSVTSIGVGIIVSDPASRQYRTRFCDVDLVLKGEKTVTVKRSIEILEQELFAHARETDSGISVSEYCSLLNQHWNNLVRVDGRQVIDAESLEHATNLSFELFIGTEPFYTGM